MLSKDSCLKLEGLVISWLLQQHPKLELYVTNGTLRCTQSDVDFTITHGLSFLLGTLVSYEKLEQCLYVTSEKMSVIRSMPAIQKTLNPWQLLLLWSSTMTMVLSISFCFESLFFAQYYYRVVYYEKITGSMFKNNMQLFIY